MAAARTAASPHLKPSDPIGNSDRVLVNRYRALR